MRYIVVTGSRDWNNREVLEEVLNREPRGTKFIEGGCKTGADQMTWEWCQKNKRPFITVLADWARLKKCAGPLRNGWMLEYKPVKVIAFFMPFSQSQNAGTSDCCRQANDLNIPIERHEL